MKHFSKELGALLEYLATPVKVERIPDQGDKARHSENDRNEPGETKEKS